MLTNILAILVVFLTVIFLLLTFIRKSHYYIKKDGKYEPFATIIIPCKGANKDFERFLDSINRQDYKNCEYLFCFTDKKDDAINMIKNSISRVKYRIIIGPTLKNTSGKTENLINGHRKASKKSDVFCWIDSDGVLDRDYIRSLVVPLQDRRITFTNSYRVHDVSSFGGRILRYWNLLSLLFKESVAAHFIWGGGVGFRKETLKELDLIKVIRPKASEDLELNRLVLSNNLLVHDVGKYVISSSDLNLNQMIKWSTRQVLLVQRCNSNVVKLGSFGLFVLILSLILYFITWNALFLSTVIGFALIMVVTMLRYAERWELVYLPVLFVLMPPILIYIVIRVKFMKKMEWAGKIYHIDKNGIILKVEKILEKIS